MITNGPSTSTPASAAHRGSRRPATSARREEILKVAAEVFARRGVAATTVREIADAVGILSGSLYHHFDSKESMVDEILRDYWAARLENYRRFIEEGGDAPSILERMIGEVLRSTAEQRAQVLILHNDWPYLVQFDRFAYLDDAAAEVERQWVKVIRQGVREGSLRSDLDAALSYRTMMGAASWVARWYRAEGRHSMATIARTQTSLFLDGLRSPRSE